MDISIGSVILDDIILPDGQAHMARLGGGAVHAVMGMRVWSQTVGLLTPVGPDCPADVLQALGACFDLGGLIVREHIKTPRAWQLFETDGTRNEVFRTDFQELVNTFPRVDEIPAGWPPLRSVHLHCPPHQVPVWAAALRQRGSGLILWEPYDGFCTAETLGSFGDYARLVDVVSPNLNEGRALTGETQPDRVLAALLAAGARTAALRMGALGSLVGSAQGSPLAVPVAPAARVVDVTGAGNAYCGGFVVGLAEAGSLRQAGGYGAVAASFALEQFGALYDTQNLRTRAEERLARLRCE